MRSKFSRRHHGLHALADGGPRTDYASTSSALVVAGGQCTIAIAFKPKAAATQTGTITIKVFNPNGPLTIALTGVGD